MNATKKASKLTWFSFVPNCRHWKPGKRLVCGPGFVSVNLYFGVLVIGAGR